MKDFPGWRLSTIIGVVDFPFFDENEAEGKSTTKSGCLSGTSNQTDDALIFVL